MTNVKKVQAVAQTAVAEMSSEPGNSAAAASHPVLVTASRPDQRKLYEVGAGAQVAGLAQPRGRVGVQAQAESELSRQRRALAQFRYEAHRLSSEIAALEAIRDRTVSDPNVCHQSQLALAEDICIELNWRHQELRGAMELVREAQTAVERLEAAQGRRVRSG